MTIDQTQREIQNRREEAERRSGNDRETLLQMAAMLEAKLECLQQPHSAREAQDWPQLRLVPQKAVQLALWQEAA